MTTTRIAVITSGKPTCHHIALPPPSPRSPAAAQAKQGWQPRVACEHEHYIKKTSLHHLQLLFRLWTMSHSSEHIEGIPPPPSRLNPSQFAASPNSSPSRNLPHHVQPQAVPRQQGYPPEGPVPNIAGYSQEGLDSLQRPDRVDAAWNEQQQQQQIPESSFMDRTSSFVGRVDSTHRQGLGYLGQGSSVFGHSRFQNNQMEPNAEASEQQSTEQLYSETPRISSPIPAHASGSYSTYSQPHQQTNGNSHMTDWPQHTNRSNSFQ